MSKTSNAAKDRWRKANYTQVNISVKPEIAAAFKTACEADNVSIAGEITKFMETRCGFHTLRKPPKDLLASRSGRRKLMRILVVDLDRIREAEEAYRDSIPDNLCGSVNYEAAEESIAAIEDALNALIDAY